VGLLLLFRTPRRIPRSFLWKLYLRRNPFLLLLFTSSLLLRRHHCFFFLALALFSQPLAPRHCMPIKRVVHQSKMAKKGMKKQALGWVPSSFDDTDLKKAKRERFMPASAEIVFPSTEAIPSPPVGFWVMFLAFLLRGFSLPAHEFLRGLLFVYGVLLHQLKPNSLLHIACFITLCEAFLGIEPH
jgi:hypothetical protein